MAADIPKQEQASELEPEDLSWLARFPADERVIGPIQRSEALALFGLLRVLRPRLVVEMGFLHGDSTAVLCAATAGCEGARVISVDRDHNAAAVDALRARYPHLEFQRADQRAARLPDDGAPIDFLFVDCSHDFDINCAMWAALEPRLAPNAVVMVHDTGLWADGPTPAQYRGWGQAGEARGARGWFHQPAEVRFVRWVTDTHADWARMDFLCTHVWRHGFTLLQRRL